MRRAHVALRTCVGCRRRFAKENLVRFVVNQGQLDLGNAEGRGTYLCRSQCCLEAALKRRDFGGVAGRTECAQALERLRSLVISSGEGRADGRDGRIACEVNGGSVIG